MLAPRVDAASLPRLRMPEHVKINLVATTGSLRACVEHLLAGEHTVLGVDLEWRPGSRLPALLQVASEEEVHLIDLVALRDAAETPGFLHALLCCEHVVKIGWRFATDLSVLAAWAPSLCRVHAYVDISHGARAAEGVVAEQRGLAQEVRRVLAHEMCKAEQCSDWEARPLREPQVEYAALDAYVLILLVQCGTALLADPEILEVKVPRVERVGEGGCDEACEGWNSESNLERVTEKGRTRKGDGGAKRVDVHSFQSSPFRSNSKREAFISRFCVRSQVYSNCRILALSGALIAHCDKSKAEWYVRKGLGTRVELEEPYTVRLTFNPEERRIGEEFEKQASPIPRLNRCVVCGVENCLSRFHLIPKTYERHFSVGMKAHQSHDIVLLCVDCHEVSNRVVMKLKMVLAEELDAPLNGVGRPEPSKEERGVVKAASALLRGVERVPPGRVHELNNVVRAWLGDKRNERAAGVRIPGDRVEQPPFCSETLQYALRLGTEKTNLKGRKALLAQFPEYKSHGELVMQRLKEVGGEDTVHDFVIRWRRHFVEHLAPRFLPEDWHIDYRIPDRRRGVLA